MKYKWYTITTAFGGEDYIGFDHELFPELSDALIDGIERWLNYPIEITSEIIRKQNSWDI